MAALRSLAFNVLFYAWSALVLLLAVPSLLLPPAVILRVQKKWIGVTLALLAGICRLRHEVRGLEHLPRAPCIIASNHQSAWDILIFCHLLDGPALVFKRELLKIPLFGRYIQHAGCIPIDRKGGAKALRRLIADGRRALENGRYIVIYPEGTRLPPGQHLPHHPGVAALYTQLQVPVVPVALNSGLFWGRRTFIKQTGRITIAFLEPIAPGLTRKEFKAELERTIDTASERLAVAPRPKV